MKITAIIPSSVWVGPNGRTASIYGASPWGMGPNPGTWAVEQRGFTVENDNGTVGDGRIAFKTREAAEEYMRAANALDWDACRTINKREGR